ncbi:adenosine kinase-like protein 2 [Dermatophagoides farinae]|uniref:Adenosine kinase n=1 Tax=Dermatophagoides farinae TaxID=6954 RepID=A0A9D4NS57_DERFA|nr:adenosine kinase 1-like [Dermatophagoides farinae]KAH7638021.1 adenosine kinase-like protein 2 [Dermatophagoides farinae]
MSTILKNNFNSAIIGIGHPLFDLIVTNVDQEFLHRYQLESDNAILADNERHQILCDELIENFNDIQFVPGGSIQNTIRVAQWFFDQPNVCTIFGCIGNDDFGHQMKCKIEQEDHVKSIYCIDNTRPTGKCVCLINVDSNGSHHRSLVTFLDACHGFRMEILQQNLSLFNNARIIYTSGFFLISNPDCVQLLAELCRKSSNDIKFALNLSASYVVKNHSQRLLQIFPYVDLLFGNENEAFALAETLEWDKDDKIDDIVEKMAHLESKKTNRTVIITQGPDEIIVVSTNSFVQKFPVPSIPTGEIIDTNGSGDAFVGGFLAYHLTGHSMIDCINAGTYAAQQVIRCCGCTLPESNELRLSN